MKTFHGLRRWAVGAVEHTQKQETCPVLFYSRLWSRLGYTEQTALRKRWLTRRLTLLLTDVQTHSKTDSQKRVDIHANSQCSLTDGGNWFRVLSLKRNFHRQSRHASIEWVVVNHSKLSFVRNGYVIEVVIHLKREAVVHSYSLLT